MADCAAHLARRRGQGQSLEGRSGWAMVEVVTWLVAVEALGLASLPLALWLLRSLPDRGIAFAKPLGLLIVGYILWLGSALGSLAHSRASALTALILLGAVAWFRLGSEALGWIRNNRRQAVLTEAVFLAGFAFAALLRAYNPDISGTEKPMDFAFLNAALRDEGVPPQDPWLAGHGISYYYFGYFLFALIAKLAGTPGAFAFNLALATLFGLVAAGAYSLVWNLVAGREGQSRGGTSAPVRYGLLAASFALLLSNLEGLLEVLFVNRVLPTGFWQWLGIKDLVNPVGPAAWIPTDPPDTWWWWRASRVVGDFDQATGASRDYTINEFPFFSFLLGDLHPHVMSLPFVFLGLALALSILRQGDEVHGGWLRANLPRAALWAIVIGALGFLNSWDLPMMLGVLVLAVTAQRALVGNLSRQALLRRALGLGALALVAGILLYFPFYLGFRTQASGIGLVETRTKVQHLFVVWGPLLVTSAALPMHLAFAGRRRAFVQSLAVAGAAFALAGVLGLAFLDEGGMRSTLGAVAGLPNLILGAFTAAVLAMVLLPSGIAYWRLLGAPQAEKPQVPREDIFALILVGAAVGLLALCEVVFVRDGFGNRMNTVFKLYYQAWVLLAPAAAYALYYLGLRRRLSGWRGASLAGYNAWRWVAVGLLACGFVYTVLAPLSKTGNFAGPPTLDGLAWLQRRNPQEREAIAWLAGRPGTPVVLEASGGEYSEFNRASAFTGLPSVLGWAGHEYQWRGSTPEPAQRKADIDTIYQTPDAATAERLLRKYQVTYVYVGDQERQAYPRVPAGALEKFARLGDVAFRNDRVVIYRLY